MAASLPSSGISDRLGALVARARTLEAEGVPFPTDEVRTAVDAALAEGDHDRAASILKRAETLYSNASRDWMWVRELLLRAEELRDLSVRVGVDITRLDARVGHPRDQLRAGPLSSGALERTAASASLSLAILNETLPKFFVQEAQKLGESIRRARDRGEDVTQSTAEFRRLVASIQEEHLAISAQRLLDARRAVGRIPPAPTVGPLPSAEEEEILKEARNLARRLHRIRGKASDARSAARLMTQVRAALSEDRRFGTPEEEIEDLWSEVDRLTKERAASLSDPVTEDLPDDPPVGSHEVEAEADDSPGPPLAEIHRTPLAPPIEEAPAEPPVGATDRPRRRRRSA